MIDPKAFWEWANRQSKWNIFFASSQALLCIAFIVHLIAD